MSGTNPRVCVEIRVGLIVSLAILLVWPTEAAIARSSLEIQQIHEREGRDSSDTSTESVEWHKAAMGLPALIIEDTQGQGQGTSGSEVDQQLIPDPLPPVFDAELALPAPRRLDVLQEAGAELPWPIGAYNVHSRGIRIASNDESAAHEHRRQFLNPERSDKRHRYMHSILHGFGDERNVEQAFLA